jgi:beta-mannanase
VKSFGQAVDTHELKWQSKVGKNKSKTRKIIWSGKNINFELEWDSSVRKNNSKTSKIIWSGNKYKWVRVSQVWGRITVILVKSFGQTIDINELEWESSVWKNNSKTSKIIWSGNKYKWARVRVKSGED